MSAGSDASNLGYRSAPFANVNGNFVNKGSTNNPANFSSNEIPGSNLSNNILSGIKDNVLAMSGGINNFKFFKGGSKRLPLRKRIKNITKLYKMKKYSTKRIKSRLRRKFRRGKSRRNRTSSRRYYGGTYNQYGSNIPSTPGYSTGGPAPVGGVNIALANPVRFERYGGLKGGAYPGHCCDNQNAYAKTCSPSMP
jgi:hypothetical protein